jgi:hypothetical protein
LRFVSNKRCTNRLNLMKSFFRHLFSVITLSALAASIVISELTGMWWVFELGVLAAVILAWLNSMNETSDEAGPVQEKEYTLDDLNPKLRNDFQALLAKQQQILKILDELKDNPTLASVEISARINTLVDSYFALLRRLEKIRPFITKDAVQEARNAMELLNVQVEKCSDDVTRENLAMALENKKDELQRLVELRKHKARIESQLVNLLSAFNSLYLRMLQVSLNPSNIDESNSEINDKINELLEDLDISENVAQELQAIVEVRPGPHAEHALKDTIS